RSHHVLLGLLGMTRAHPASAARPVPAHQRPDGAPLKFLAPVRILAREARPAAALMRLCAPNATSHTGTLRAAPWTLVTIPNADDTFALANSDALKRIFILNVQPIVDGGRFAAKAITTDRFTIEADLVC